MKCPVCPDVQLLMTSRLEVEIDYCPNCRGVWLDRGELDKIIETNQRELDAPAQQAAWPHGAAAAYPAAPMAYPAPRHGGGHHGSGHGSGYGSGGFLRRLFD